ncbi:hypothetical protein MLD38_022835 [Melastoma candidum]|uniref:Uncharacterized protein n=1 Tax=Melastoma candidum TaxID=119954 RepID=A0ACB9QPJ1_9MYRT|nr:hypothetical protein MLD38_022835 [Melastoma candidum]
MGCICSKGIYPKDKDKKSIRSSKKYAASYRKDGVVDEVDGCINDATARLISSPLETENEGDTNKEVVSSSANEKPVRNLQRRLTIDIGVGNVPNGEKGAQVVTAWPPWLTAVAGESIAGWAPRRAESFEKLEKIGQGTYSSVYKARDLETNKIVALKKVKFANMDPESVRFMAREIIILQKLDHPNIMKLEGLITSKVSGSLYLIFEYMEHDLAGLAATPGVKFSEAQIKCYMQQLFRGLEYCHAHGVLHRDIKGSNLLIDNNGNLKIGDFGLATFFQSNLKQPLTSRVVTLWYRPPELLLGATDYGASVDLWSSGCILAELLAGKPIMPGRTEVEQLHKIFKLCGSPSEEYWEKSKLPHATIFKPQQPYKRCLSETYKDFPRSALAMLEILLAVEPGLRGSASSALQNEFFTTRPLPSDPSTLPKYPPSKEFDAKLRDEERRRKASGVKGRGNDPIRNDKDSKALPLNVNADLSSSKQKQKANVESATTKHGNGGATQSNISRSGPLVNNDDSGSLRIFNPREDLGLRRPAGESAKMTELITSPSSHIHRNTAELSRFSNLVAVRGSSLLDSNPKTAGVSHWPDEPFNNHLGSGEMSEKDVWSHSLLDRPNSSHKKGKEQSGKEYPMGNSPRKLRIHYSGPLMPPGGNMEELLKEHERQIQHAVRKARLDNAKTRNGYGKNGQTESLLYGTQAHGR